MSAKIGKVVIVGNELTSAALILAQVELEPGSALSYPALRKAEEDLAKIKFFEVDAAKGVRPTVTVIDSGGDVKDLLITVKEKPAKAGGAGK